MEPVLGAVFVVKLLAKGQRLAGGIRAFPGKAKYEGVEHIDPGIGGYLHPPPYPLEGGPLLYGLQDALIGGLYAKKHPLAAGPFHQPGQVLGHGIHPGKGIPFYLEVAPQHLLTYLPGMTVVEGEGVIDDVDMREAEIAVEHLDLIHHQPGATKTDPAAKHPAPGAKDAAVGAPAAGDHGAWGPQGAVPGQGQQMARRHW